MVVVPGGEPRQATVSPIIENSDEMCSCAYRRADGGVIVGKGVGDRLKPLRTAVRDLHVHKNEIRLVAPAEHLLVYRRDDENALSHVVARDEQLGGAQPHRPAIERREWLLFLIAES